jgi:hypothetical protein
MSHSNKAAESIFRFLPAADSRALRVAVTAVRWEYEDLGIRRFSFYKVLFADVSVAGWLCTFKSIRS